MKQPHFTLIKCEKLFCCCFYCVTVRVVQGIYGDPFWAADKRKPNYCHKNISFSIFRKLLELLKTETVHFVNSVKLVSVYVKLLKPLEPKVSETESVVVTKTNDFCVNMHSVGRYTMIPLATH